MNRRKKKSRLMTSDLQRPVRLINAAVNLNATTLTTIYTVPAKTVAIVREIFIANYDGSARNLNLQWVDTSASATYSLIYDKQVATDDYLRLDNLNIYLDATDILKAQAATADAFNISVFIEELFTPIL